MSSSRVRSTVSVWYLNSVLAAADWTIILGRQARRAAYRTIVALVAAIRALWKVGMSKGTMTIAGMIICRISEST